MFKNIVCFPHKLGQKKCGVEKTPKLFVEFLKKKHTNMNIYHVSCKNSEYFFNSNLKNLYHTNKQIPNNQFRLNIGGDHSMAIASLGYTLNEEPNCKVVWVDAHPDINTYEESDSKNFHGMPLAYLTGLQRDNRFGFLHNKLPFEHLLYIGLRSIDDFEQKVIHKHNIYTIGCEDVNKNLENTLSKIDNFLGNSPFHLSFDVDSLDPSVISCTGTPVENGIQEECGIKLINHLVKKNTLKNMDLTEINTELANSKDIIEKTFNYIEKTIHPLF